MDRQRKHERYEFAQPVELVLKDGEALAGRLKDFSLGGAFVFIDPQPEFGSKVTLRIELPGVPDICQIPCFIRWRKEGEGVGIQFEYTRPIEVWALSKLIRKIKQETSEQ